MQALIAPVRPGWKNATRLCRLSGAPAGSARTAGCLTRRCATRSGSEPPSLTRPLSLRITGTTAEWEDWTDMTSPKAAITGSLAGLPPSTSTASATAAAAGSRASGCATRCEHAMGSLRTLWHAETLVATLGDHLTGPLRLTCGQWPVAAGAQAVPQAPGVAARERTFWLIGAGLRRRSEPVNSGSGTATLTTRSGLAGRSCLAANCGLVKRSGSDSAGWAAARLVKVPPNLYSAAGPARKVPTAGSSGWSSAAPGWPARKRGACAGSYAARTAAAQARQLR